MVPFVEADIKNGPDKATGAMAVLVAMLYERYKAGRYPIAHGMVRNFVNLY